jgi:ribosomal protein S27E
MKGEWIDIGTWSNSYKCSVCGRTLINITDGKNNVSKHYPFCHCGADMRKKIERKEE